MTTQSPIRPTEPSAATKYTYRVLTGFRVRFTAGARAGQTATGTLVTVANHENGATYHVHLLEGCRPTCSCRQFQYRCAGTARVCKHIAAAIRFVTTGRGDPTPREKPARDEPAFDADAEARYLAQLEQAETDLAAKRARTIQARELWD